MGWLPCDTWVSTSMGERERARARARLCVRMRGKQASARVEF